MEPKYKAHFDHAFTAATDHKGNGRQHRHPGPGNLTYVARAWYCMECKAEYCAGC